VISIPFPKFCAGAVLDRTSLEGLEAPAVPDLAPRRVTGVVADIRRRNPVQVFIVSFLPKFELGTLFECLYLSGEVEIISGLLTPVVIEGFHLMAILIRVEVVVLGFHPFLTMVEPSVVFMFNALLPVCSDIDRVCVKFDLVATRAYVFCT